MSEAQQSDPRLLAAVYDDMAQKFRQHGLDTKAVQAMRQYFKIDGPGARGSLHTHGAPATAAPPPLPALRRSEHPRRTQQRAKPAAL